MGDDWWTLKDLRSAYSKGGEHALPEEFLKELRRFQRQKQTIGSVIDALITHWQSNFPAEYLEDRDASPFLRAKVRKKNTSEVAPTRDAPSEDSTMHGGDGNSGEVDAPAKTSSDKIRKGDRRRAKKVVKNRSAFSNQEYWDSRRTLKNYRWQQGAAAAKPSNEGPCSVPGGAHIDPTKKEPKVPQEAREIITALMKLVNKWCGPVGSPSPRIDAKLLVKELVSKRMNLSCARKREMDDPVVLLLPDISGSCSATCQEFWRACEVLNRIEPRLVVIPHSNGYVEREYIGVTPSAIPKLKDLTLDRGLDGWVEVMKRFNVAGAVAFGDSDAIDVYQLFAETGKPFVWFDSYGKKTSGLRVIKERIPGWKIQPIAHYAGVGGYQSLAIALRGASQK